MVRREVVYFEELNPDNTDETIEAVRKAVEDLGLKYVVVATGTGGGCDTAYVISSCHANMFFDKEKGLEFRELIALSRKKKFW